MVFGERGHRLHCLRKTVGCRVHMKRTCGALPASKRVCAWWVDVGNPNVAARVFKQAKDIVSGQAIPHRIDRFRSSPGELFRTARFPEPAQPLAGRYPPLPRVVLKRALVPTPAEIVDRVRILGTNGGKALSAEAVER